MKYNEHFNKELQKNLGKSSSFLKKDNKRKIFFQNKLDDLYRKENKYDLPTFNEKMDKNFDFYFGDTYLAYRDRVFLFMSKHKKKDKRTNKIIGKTQLKSVFDSIILVWFKDKSISKKNFNNLNNLDTFNKNIFNIFSSKDFFHSLIRIALRQRTESLTGRNIKKTTSIRDNIDYLLLVEQFKKSSKEKEYSTDFFIYENFFRAAVFELLLTRIMYFSLKSITKNNGEGPILKKWELLVGQTIRKFKYTQGRWDKKNPFYKIVNTNHMLVDEILENLNECLFLKHKIDNRHSTPKFKYRTLLFFPTQILKLTLKNNHLPYITEPKKYVFGQICENNPVSHKTHIISDGTELSERTLKSLNISQSKKFKISETAIDVFNDLSNLSLEDSYLIQNKVAFNVIDDYTEDSILHRKRDEFFNVLGVAPILLNFPIFFPNYLDFRGRLMQSTFLFSKTSGDYKYLVTEFKNKTLTLRGFYRMLESYYQGGDRSYLEKFLLKYELPGTGRCFKRMQNMATFFKENKYPVLFSDRVVYYSILEREIQKSILNGFRTDFMLEIDQKSSSSVFLSLFCENKELARSSNLYGSAGDFYDQIRRNALEFMLLNNRKDSSGVYFSSKVIRFLVKDKNPLKQITLAYLYTQRPFQRFLDLKKRGESLGLKLSPEEEDALYNFSFGFEKIIRMSYEDLPRQIKLIIKWYETTSKLTKDITLRTIDGSSFRYRYAYSKKISTKRWSITSNTRKSFSYNLYDDRANNRKGRVSFLANIIQSIEAGFIRILIADMSELHNYKIQTLHDSISVHPNKLDDVWDCIYYIYVNDTFRNLAEKTVFQPWENSIPLAEKNSSTYRRAYQIKKEFNSLKSVRFRNRKNSFKPENMYPLK